MIYMQTLSLYFLGWTTMAEWNSNELKLLLKNLLEKDDLTLLHSYRVTKMAVSFAEYLQLNDLEIKTIELGGLLHDIGKINITENILTKKGKLDPKEYTEIKRHPLYGVDLLNPFSSLNQKIKDMVLFHHERWDGLGYPYGLKNEEIPLLARVLTLVDSLEAMTGKRPYRSSMSWQEAYEEVERGKGTQFDPKATELCLKWMENFNHVNEVSPEMKINKYNKPVNIDRIHG